MEHLYRRTKQWSVIFLGCLLFLLVVGHALADDDIFAIDFIEVLLPFVVGLGLIVGGVWLTRTHNPSRIRQLAKWTIGGAIVGIAANLWFLFIISLEQAPTGEPIVLNLNSAGIGMAGGVLLGYYATGLREREEQLSISDNRFRALTENAPFAVVTIDETSTIQYANEAVIDLFGYAPDELVGKSITYLLPDRSAGVDHKRMSQLTSGDADIEDYDSIEIIICAADGTEFPVEVSSGSYTVDNTRIFTGIFQDISDRKEAEAQLEEHTEKVTELHQIATDITSAASEEAVYQRAACGAMELFSADTARVAIVEGDQFVLAASSGPQPAEEGRSMATTRGYAGQSYQYGKVLRLGDMTDTRSAASSPVQNGGVSPDQELKSLLSIPLAKYGVLQVCAYEPAAFSERDEEVAEMLATHVATAIQRIEAEATIRCERDRLEEFAGLVSHDLRNPLTVAQGRVELIQITDDPAEHLPSIETALDRMERLIDDMLTLAREGGAIDEMERVSLRAVANHAWKNVTTEAATLEIESDRQFEADRSRLIQVFENLFRNAVEHGSETVTIRVGTLDNGFYIEDTGPGIPEDKRETIFESGYSTDQDGTGFGLSIVKRIVEAHDWTIEATEGTDGGARFEILEL